MSALGSIVFAPQPGSQTTASQHLSAERIHELLQHEQDNHALRRALTDLLALVPEDHLIAIENPMTYAGARAVLARAEGRS